MASYSENKCDGVMPSWGDNKDDGVVATDADDAGYDKPVSITAIKAGTNPGYKGPGNTSLSVGDPRFA